VGFLEREQLAPSPTARGLDERYKLPEGGLGWSPSHQGVLPGVVLVIL